MKDEWLCVFYIAYNSRGSKVLDLTKRENLGSRSRVVFFLTDLDIIFMHYTKAVFHYIRPTMVSKRIS